MSAALAHPAARSRSSGRSKQRNPESPVRAATSASRRLGSASPSITSERTLTGLVISAAPTTSTSTARMNNGVIFLRVFT